MNRRCTRNVETLRSLLGEVMIRNRRANTFIQLPPQLLHHHAVDVHTLFLRGTIEEYIMHVLTTKLDMFRTVIGEIEAVLRRHFGTLDLFVTTDKNAALLDSDLRLLSPNSALTILLARLIRERGTSCHRGRLKLGTTPKDILASAQNSGLVAGATLSLGEESERYFLRVVHRIRFVREQVQERLLTCCVDYESGDVRSAADLSLIKHLINPLPSIAL